MTSRRVAGRKAQNKGKGFETFLERACWAQGIVAIRIPDGCRKINGGFGRLPKLLPVKSPFDWILGFEGRVVCLDTKNLGDKRLAYSALKQHQVQALWSLGKHCVAGYLVFFNELGMLSFFNGATLKKLCSGDSLGIEDAQITQRIDSIDLRELFKLRS